MVPNAYVQPRPHPHRPIRLTECHEARTALSGDMRLVHTRFCKPAFSDIRRAPEEDSNGAAPCYRGPDAHIVSVWNAVSLAIRGVGTRFTGVPSLELAEVRLLRHRLPLPRTSNARAFFRAADRVPHIVRSWHARRACHCKSGTGHEEQQYTADHAFHDAQHRAYAAVAL